jgi:hypothetical protein
MEFGSGNAEGGIERKWEDGKVRSCEKNRTESAGIRKAGKIMMVGR